MALTRNESAVHEKIGVYERSSPATTTPWCSARTSTCASSRRSGRMALPSKSATASEIRRSLQFFDAAGEAVHKVHLRPASNVYAYQALVAALDFGRPGARRRRYQGPARTMTAETGDARASLDELRDRWSRLHRRAPVLRHAGDAEARPAAGGAHGRRGLCLEARRRCLGAMLHHAAADGCRSCASSAIAAASRSIPARSRRSSRWGRGSTSSTRPSTCICGPTTSQRCGRCASRPRTAMSPRSKPTTPTAR